MSSVSSNLGSPVCPRGAVPGGGVLRGARALALSCALGISCWLVSHSVHAEGYGPAQPRGRDTDAASGRRWLGFENLFGYSSLQQKVNYDADSGGGKSSVDVSQFSLLGGGTGNAYASPRLSLDFRVGDKLTVGGALSYFSGSASAPSDAGSVEVDVSGFSVNPRLGVLLGSDQLGLWPRVGWAAYSSTAETETVTTETSGSALVLDLPIVFRGPLMGIAVGPSLYLPTGGSVEATNSLDDKIQGTSSLGGWGLNFSAFVAL